MLATMTRRAEPADALTRCWAAVHHATLALKAAEARIEGATDRYRTATAYPQTVGAAFLAESRACLQDAVTQTVAAQTQYTSAMTALLATLDRLDHALTEARR